MSITLLLPHFRSPYLCSPLKPSTPSLSFKCGRSPRSPASYPCIRAVDLDQTTVLTLSLTVSNHVISKRFIAVIERKFCFQIVTASVGLISVAVGISIPIFCKQSVKTPNRDSLAMAPVPAKRCRFCMGSGTISVELGGDEKEVSKCINCEGVGSLSCTTCQGSGIQPRYLDRREFKDDDNDFEFDST
ncbi:hypothetical protein SCA6_010755, partial [Theobroma cacao]